MTAPRLLAGRLLGAVLLVLPAAAPRAQTTVNPGALDQLAPPAPEAPIPQSAPKHAPPKRGRPSHGGRTAASGGPAKGGGTHPAAKPPAAKPPPRRPLPTVPPAVPRAAPPPPELPPPVAVPTRPPPAAEPVAISKDAPGQALPAKDGLRITFGVGRADVNEATNTAVRALARHHASRPGTTFSVTAYAGGNADDPSTPRRLSLDRALQIRSILMAEGIPSERIYVKAMGPPQAGGDASPDRVDVVISEPQPATGPPPAPAVTGAPAGLPQRGSGPPSAQP